MKTVIPIGNARERFAALEQGRTPPPRNTPRQRLSEELVDQWLSALAIALTPEFIADREGKA